MRLPQENIDSETRKPLSRIRPAELGAQCPHARHDGGEILLHLAGEVDTELLTSPNISPGTRGPDQGFGGHTADVQAVAAHEVPFDQRDFRAKPCRNRCRYQAGRAGSDHHEVIAADRCWVHPVRRMDIIDQALIVFVIGDHHVGGNRRLRRAHEQGPFG